MPWSRIPEGRSDATGDRMLSYREAIREAIDQALVYDPSVFVMGLDVDDQFGVFGTTLNLREKDRVIGTPIAENAMTGVALGAALSGMRPIHVHMRCDFMMVAMDPIVNYVAKWRHMYRAQVKVPIVIRAVIGRGWGCGAQHSQTLHSMFAHIPGIKVVMPSTPYDVKGLFLAAVREDYPVIFIEHRWLYNNQSHVPQNLYFLPIGKAKIVREGRGLTAVATSIAAMDTLSACEKKDLEVEVIDVRTLKPLDEELILRSVRKTGRLVIVDYDFPSCGFAAEVCALVAEKGLGYLKAPVQRITFPECSMPASGILENVFYPSSDTIAARLKDMLVD